MKLSVTKKILTAYFASAVLISCRTLHEPKTVYEPLNYTEQDIYDAEVKRIDLLAETSPVEALWSAALLKDKAALQLCVQKVEEKYRKAVDDKDYYTALTYCRSLDAAGAGETEYGGMTRQKLEE